MQSGFNRVGEHGLDMQSRSVSAGCIVSTAAMLVSLCFHVLRNIHNLGGGLRAAEHAPASNNGPSSYEFASSMDGGATWRDIKLPMDDKTGASTVERCCAVRAVASVLRREEVGKMDKKCILWCCRQRQSQGISDDPSHLGIPIPFGVGLMWSARWSAGKGGGHWGTTIGVSCG